MICVGQIQKLFMVVESVSSQLYPYQRLSLFFVFALETHQPNYFPKDISQLDICSNQISQLLKIILANLIPTSSHGWMVISTLYHHLLVKSPLSVNLPLVYHTYLMTWWLIPLSGLYPWFIYFQLGYTNLAQ